MINMGKNIMAPTKVCPRLEAICSIRQDCLDQEAKLQGLAENFCSTFIDACRGGYCLLKLISNFILLLLSLDETSQLLIS